MKERVMPNKNSLLPTILQDKNNLAIESCIKEAFFIDMKKFLIRPYENASDELLSFLAKEAHVLGPEGWNLAKNRQEKLNIIESSFEKHLKKGSIPSIKEALKNINIDAEISEFWEYGGRPAHFIVKFLNIYDRGLNNDFETQIKDMINIYKPATRILDYINYYLCCMANIYITTRIQLVENTVIKTKEVII